MLGESHSILVGCRVGQMVMSEAILCSPVEAAKRLGIGKTKLYDLLAKGELASMQIGTRRLITVESIKAFVERATGGAK